MKGLLLSLFIFAVYIVTAIALAHVRKPERHAPLFFGVFLVFSPVYFLCYLMTPPALWFISENWLASPTWLDMTLGYVIFGLNMHSFLDYFFGFNGGFSTSIMLNVYRNRPRGLTTDEIIARYRTEDGSDKIMGWRLPQLEKSGYLVIDSTTQRCTLTPKGQKVATLTYAIKRILNLSKGG